MKDIIEYAQNFDSHTIIAISVILYFFMKIFREEIAKEILEIRNEVREIKEENKQQSKRIDRLYEMFVDLLKEKK